MSAKWIKDPIMEQNGWVSEYIKSIKNEDGSVELSDAFGPESFQGWPKKGDIVEFLDENGYDLERNMAKEMYDLSRGSRLTIKRVNMGTWSSSYEFEEFTGKFNSVMFRKVEPDE